MRVIANSFLALSILISTQIQAATASGADSFAQLTKLEQKYLGQVYAAEPEEKRVQRLEKFVFGDVSSGDVNQRLAQLVSAGGDSTTNDTGVTTNNTAADDLIENTSAFDGTQPAANDQLAATDQTSASGQTSARDETPGNDQDSIVLPDQEQPAEAPPQGGDQYPRVGVLEKAIFGQTYPQQDVSARLNQLETKAYGKTSDSAALSDRVDNLEKYAEKKYAKEMAAQRDKLVYEEDARGREIEPGQSQVKSKVPGLVNMVSNVLFGGPGMMGNPYMGGPSIGGVGFGGVHMRDRSEVAKQEALEAAQAGQSSATDRAAVKQEDPAVRSTTPPPASAKMLTKVGWCEMKLFSHTSPEMHLPERLQQINDALNYKPGKKGIALMDDVNAMVSAVAAKNDNSNSIGSAGNPVQ